MPGVSVRFAYMGEEMWSLLFMVERNECTYCDKSFSLPDVAKKERARQSHFLSSHSAVSLGQGEVPPIQGMSHDCVCRELIVLACELFCGY